VISAIPHREALHLLLSVEANEQHEEATHAQLPAIISHWLQSPNDKPLIFNDENGKKTMRRWTNILTAYQRIVSRPPVDTPTVKPTSVVNIDFSELPFPPVQKPKFRFIDLFAGIGGFRIALQEHGGKCVFTSEWDHSAKETYFNNYGEAPFGDIRRFTSDKITNDELDRLIPDHEILAAGFPCQPFSHAGVSARNSLGQKHGFSCEIQGTLFFDLMRIAKVKKPDVLLLENVKNLRSHDGGKTFQRIRETIENDLEYSFSDDVIDACSLVPQKRKRCYMVCFRDKRKFKFPLITGPALPLSSILETNPDPSYTISDRLWRGHINRSQRNVDRGTGFTAYAADLSKPSNTLVARYYKDGKECLVPQKDANPRLLMPLECAKLQGYPEKFIFHPSKKEAYRQFGNSVAVPVVRKVVEAVLAEMKGLK
jgi:DNA (cytosine-5)-methyltransferase 1